MARKKRGVHIVDPKPTKPTFAQQVESRARQLTKRLNQNREQDPTLDTLTHEVALTVDQIDGLRRSHEKVRRNLLRQECYLETEITQREPRPPVYEDPRLPERDRLRDRLRAVEKERRRLLLSEEEALRPLHDRLLSLLNRHDQLWGPSGADNDWPSAPFRQTRRSPGVSPHRATQSNA